MSFTEAQRKAIDAHGNVLVVAGAGAGKTSTLVERCVTRLLAPADPAGLDEILMVTFTEAAAAGMKQRIRARLGMELEGTRDAAVRSRIEEQLALLDISRIGTLHGFCLRLVREHGHELALDPQMTVLAEEQSAALMEETLDGILRSHYAGGTALGPAVEELIAVQANGREEVVRELVFKLHHYTQTLPDPGGWFQKQLEQFRQPDAGDWHRWLSEAFQEWRTLWVPELVSQPSENERAHQCAERLTGLDDSPSRQTTARVLDEIIRAGQDFPHGTKGRFRDPIEDFFTDAAFLRSLARTRDGTDPLVEDWNWVRRQMETLLNLAMEFSNGFAKAKRDEGALDFHDLEQFTLRLVWDNSTGRPLPLAEALRQRFKVVFVDEYQDINAAQDRIIEALSRGGSAVLGNRFLVGDVKQSIYRFRLSDPRIFQNYRKKWAAGAGHESVLTLAENFRSRERLLQFINPIFAELMREEIGGVACGPDDELKFGSPETRRMLSAETSTESRVEVHLQLKERTDAVPDAASDEGDSGLVEMAEAGDAEIEAGRVAKRLRALVAEGHPVWDEQEQAFRPVGWGDMVILLRSVRNKAESYAKEFNRQGVPLEAERGGFYENAEITDLLSLLELLDNPIQDVPLLAVLRSPLVGLSLDELATIRLASRHGHFWTALKRWRETETGNSSAAGSKVDRFLKRHARWRRMARETSLSQRLETVLDETNYRDWLLAQPRGEQRLANVRHLLVLAQQFDPFQRQGLQRFLRFVEAQRGAQVDSELPSVEARNAVRLMSIHKSKGLEFPVVVLAGLGGRFNLRDLSDHVVLDEDFGLCPQVKPPETGRRYPSLPWWRARQRQRREALGEEMRLLYVAMTRARDTLLLAGTVSRKKAEVWPATATGSPSHRQLLKAGTALDWLGPLLAKSAGNPDWVNQPAGQANLFRWTIQNGREQSEGEESPVADEPLDAGADDSTVGVGAEELRRLRERIEWQYPFATAAREPAKTSVSLLRRRADEADAEARQLFQPVGTGRRRWTKPAGKEMPQSLSASEIGSAHHLFLEAVALDQVGTEAGLKREADRLCQAGVLDARQLAALDFSALSAFWQSELGRSICEHPEHVHRELAFTARMSPADLIHLGLPINLRPEDDEFLVVQGVVDLAVILPDGIRIVDFKTDRVAPEDLDEKVRHYAPQLKLYGCALDRIHGRPVTESSLHFLAPGRTVRL